MACESCGRFIRGYAKLCFTCRNLKDRGSITRCPDCEEWYATDSIHECESIDEYNTCTICGNKCQNNRHLLCYNCWLNQNENDEDDEECDDEDDENEGYSLCLICKSPANGYDFCKSCFGKYRNKTISLKVVNCRDFELLDEKYTNERTYITDDGHKVKSKSEILIDNFLFEQKIRHIYEMPYAVSKDIELKPDFYLPDYDIFIEHFGMDKPNYTKIKEYKIPIYEKAKLTVICTDEKDAEKNMTAALKRKLKFHEKNKINYLD